MLKKSFHLEFFLLIPDYEYILIDQQGMERVNGKMSLDEKGPVYLSYILSGSRIYPT